MNSRLTLIFTCLILAATPVLAEPIDPTTPDGFVQAFAFRGRQPLAAGAGHQRLGILVEGINLVLAFRRQLRGKPVHRGGGLLPFGRARFLAVGRGSDPQTATPAFR